MQLRVFVDNACASLRFLDGPYFEAADRRDGDRADRSFSEAMRKLAVLHTRKSA